VGLFGLGATLATWEANQRLEALKDDPELRKLRGELKELKEMRSRKLRGELKELKEMRSKT